MITVNRRKEDQSVFPATEGKKEVSWSSPAGSPNHETDMRSQTGCPHQTDLVPSLSVRPSRCTDPVLAPVSSFVLADIRIM